MSEVKKDAVYPVKVWPPGWDHSVDLAPMIPALRKRVGEFIEAGLPIPVVWRHDDGAIPGKEKLGELMAGDARLALGWATGSEVDADGIFQGNFEIPDEADRNELKKSRYVSPWIKENWRDGSGKVWPGPSILHFAVTPRPVQHGQQTWQLGHDEKTKTPPPSLDLRLSLSDYERGIAMADEPPKKAGKDEKVKDEGGKLKDIIKCLAELNPPIILPADTDETTFLDRLHVGCMTAGGHKPDDDKGGAMNTPAPPKDTPTEVKDGQNPMGLSHEDKALLEQARGSVAFAQELSRKDMLARITKLRGNIAIGKPALDKLEAELTGLKLSLDSTGRPTRTELLAKIEALEEVPLLLSRDENGEQPRPVPHPEEVKKAPDAHVMSKLTGSRYKTKP